ncbi:aldo/keto reductase [Fulvimarina endophytica]|uniref:Aldo/keto reductase n=2 Tax=Fulvimarina endophytica TaxID=2293836 RepID=A0A371XAP3_9HYPH|nr:aldo/keto reductase [Fulvimarina endophytica]
MKTVSFAEDLELSVLGQGTWRLGDAADRRDTEIRALRTGIDLGMTVIDTAELYGSGRSERLVGEAISACRDEVTLVSKVMPSNASRRGTIEACERSLKHLDTDRIDLYLLHWLGAEPLGDTFEAFEELRAAGKIRHWGVSNLDREDLDKALDLAPEGTLVANQLYYSLEERGIEYRFIDQMRERSVGIMAYTPLGDSKSLLADSTVRAIAAEHGATPAQIALAFVLRQDNLCALVKAGSPDHVRENAAAGEIELTRDDLDRLDRAFPPPTRRQPLAII